MMNSREKWFASMSASERSLYEQMCMRLMCKADERGVSLSVAQIEKLAAQKIMYIREHGLHKIGQFKFGAIPADYPDIELKAKREVKRKSGPGPEAILLKPAQEELIEDGWLVIRVNVSAQKMDGQRFVRSVIITETGVSAGVCDVIAAKGPIALWLEFKSERGRVSEPQKDFRDLAASHGVTVHVVRSLETLRDLMRQANNKLRQFESINQLNVRIQ